MERIGIGDIQKNTAILSNLTESLEIIDKRRKRTVAIVYPVTKTNICKRLAGKYKDQVSTAKASSVLSIEQLNQVKEQVMLEAMEEKHGCTD
ncbi:MAG TPA: hypothetical protein EYH38_00635 [Leucothrix sp.]|nr:hypothetical protein [Leucothrix sp.]HIQ14064.1 hypothetical protein [Leucothrix sp.]